MFSSLSHLLLLLQVITTCRCSFSSPRAMLFLTLAPTLRLLLIVLHTDRVQHFTRSSISISSRGRHHSSRPDELLWLYVTAWSGRGGQSRDAQPSCVLPRVTDKTPSQGFGNCRKHSFVYHAAPLRSPHLPSLMGPVSHRHEADRVLRLPPTEAKSELSCQLDEIIHLALLSVLPSLDYLCRSVG